MRQIARYLAIGAALAALFVTGAAFGQANNSNTWQTPGNNLVGGQVQMCINTAGQAVPCATSAAGAAGFPNGATPITASATGTTGATAATLAATANTTTYICGFTITSGGTTAAALGNATVAGTVSGTMNFTYVAVSSGQGLLGIAFPACIPASAKNVAIVVTTPAGGAGTTIAVTAWGFQV